MAFSQAFDIASLHAAYASGWTPQEMIEEVFSRIAAINDPGIFLKLADKAVLLEQAQALGAFSPETKPLWGIPFAVKDNIDVAGLPTTAACPDYAYTPETDSTVVRLLKEAGALVIGKTNLDQFATGLVGVRTPHAIPRNAIDPKLVPGGSSSGSAVATAQGIVSFALGTDTAGSGRIPAGLNNIVGLKPSVGALSATGVIPACRTLDCVSIFALTVEDAHKVFTVAAKLDVTDAYSRPMPVGHALASAPVLRIGVPAKADREFFGDSLMEASFEKALAELSAMGHTLVDLPFSGFYEVANLLYEGAWVAERYAAVKDFFDAKPESFHPVTHTIYSAAKTLTAADAFSGMYRLQALKQQLVPVISSVDVICVPTAPTHYTLADLQEEPIKANSRLGTYTNFVNLLDMCGIAVPTGKRGDGLPSSVTLLAPSGADGLTAALGSALHSRLGTTIGATGWPLPQAPERPVEKAEGLIPVIVVGAHLSDMPLNHQLTSLNARFLRAGTTSASYKLFALPNQTPPKPGLVRVEQGAAIAVEIWQLTPAGFGQFVNMIPSPMCIGTVFLDDGSSAKGFLVEPSAVEGAEDITHLGGWRAYIASL
ncbi:allophanate hydrolase [Agrobacterium vitis]|uniref:allophanate hydrolase n=1 Tax=Rhizobium/Agrobacterium group TaxID=227290 RepID=UPI0008DBED0F|nr:MULTISPECIES: allophanate hydrolase [Rhizobium/Agrobacterium group]MCF1432955.1 allophanate hydrolase [Allorhizobium ampelinum]MCF1481235.1 allophanate hydrolase [Allorhizobium ampelinum]MUO89695.1 allophanate hydrolase [Agrobacterium vitis]MUZ51363.1 allophanate hydrolase [Agrobacterium vitis]MVA38256.1 allophanate hydrolase [Agrobacterium vitis]